MVLEDVGVTDERVRSGPVATSIWMYEKGCVLLPWMDDLIDRLGESKFFTYLDEGSGYWQVPMSPESRPKTAFVTHYGLFECSVMPFGLCNALRRSPTE